MKKNVSSKLMEIRKILISAGKKNRIHGSKGIILLVSLFEDGSLFQIIRQYGVCR
jgi:hypothetical protein